MSTAAMRKVSIDSGDCQAAPEMWDRICFSFAEHRRMFVFADFDGTLAEIVEVPGKAVLDPQTERALRRLAARPRISVAVITGRSVDDVAARVGLPLTYAGDHGIEIHSPEFDFLHPDAAAFRKRLPELANHIRVATRHMPGVLVEVKRYSASVHYRQAPVADLTALQDAVQACLDKDSFEVRKGNCVLEVRPRLKWDKGEAVAWLLSRAGGETAQAICIGDDQTDEDMFRRLPGSITIRVSPDDTEPTAADYLLRRTAVSSFLNGLADVAEACGDHCQP